MMGLCSEWTRRENAPIVSAVVSYENLAIIDAVLGLGAQAIFPQLFHSFGLLATLVLARETYNGNRSFTLGLRKVETKLQGKQNLTNTKATLMKTQPMSEAQA